MLQAAHARFARKSYWMVALSSLMTVAACSSGNDGGTGPNGSTANFKATIDGTPWTAAFASAASAAGGIFTIAGASTNGTGLSLSLYSIDVPGTYPLGVGGTVAGGLGTVSLSPNAWSTALSGAAGTVTVTSVSPTRIAGTFSFTAAPAIGQTVTNTRNVTAGQFDVAVTGPATLVVPDNASNKWSGSVAGVSFNAATIVSVALPSSGTLTIGASNNAYTLNLIMPGYAGVGTYALGGSPARTLQVTSAGTPTVWGGIAGSNTGTVTITSATATKIKGTITATLGASSINPNAGTITVTGTFEKGVP